MKNLKKYIGAAFLGSVILMFAGCSDTWDEHYNAGEGTSATESLWDIISSNPNLSRFKNIAEKSTYYRDETHPQANYTFKDLLQSSMLSTVWVPENSAFTDAEYQQWLDLAETNGYTVQQQLMGNSISLWRQVATAGGIDTLAMLNGKKLVFDKDQFTMQGLPLIEKNIPATNGTLHTLGTVIPFRYNIYEYLKDASNASANNMSRFHDYLVAQDTTYFDEGNSIEGIPDINGNATYVDSVYYTTNMMFFATHRFPSNSNTERYLTYDESFGVSIQVEDSTFIMVMPTDNAWQNAYQKLEKYYKYADKYVDKVKANSSGTTSLTYREISNPDSLKEKCIDMDIISPLCFNLHFQPDASGKIGRWKLDDFLSENGNSATYFLNTFGDTLRTDSVWDKNILIQGTRLSLSNGAGIVANEWNFPAKLYKPDLIIEVGNRSFYNFSERVGGTESPMNVGFSNSVAESWVDSVGRVSEDNFYYVFPTGASGNPKIEFKLQGTDGENRESDVMSGKYDIGIVIVPDFYMTSKDTISLLPNVSAFVTKDNDTIPYKHKIVGTVSYCNNTATKEATMKSNEVEFTGEKVDTLWLFEDFEFPYSYKNLRYSYPTLMLTTKTSNTERKNGYTNSFCIDRIIMRSKD